MCHGESHPGGVNRFRLSFLAASLGFVFLFLPFFFFCIKRERADPTFRRDVSCNTKSHTSHAKPQRLKKKKERGNSDRARARGEMQFIGEVAKLHAFAGRWADSRLRRDYSGAVKSRVCTGLVGAFGRSDFCRLERAHVDVSCIEWSIRHISHDSIPRLESKYRRVNHKCSRWKISKAVPATGGVNCADAIMKVIPTGRAEN